MEEWREKFIKQYGYDPMMFSGQDMITGFPGPGPGYVMPADYTRGRDVDEEEALAPIDPYATAPVAAATGPGTGLDKTGISLMNTAAAAGTMPQAGPGIGLDQTGIQTFPPGVIPPRGDDAYAVRPGESIGEARERLAPLIEGAGYGQPVGPNQITPETHPDLYGITPAETPASRIWAKYPLDLDAKRQRRIDAMGTVNKNAMMLRIFAGLTGSSTAHAEDYVTNAMSRFGENEDFKQDKRLQNLQRVLYWKADGTFDPPKSNEEAYERIIQAKGTDAEARALTGYLPPTTSATSGQTLRNRAQYILKLEKDAESLRKNAEKSRTEGDTASAERYETEAQAKEEEANLIRQMLPGGAYGTGPQFDDAWKAWKLFVDEYTNIGGGIELPILKSGKVVDFTDFRDATIMEFQDGSSAPGWQAIIQGFGGTAGTTGTTDAATTARQAYEAEVRRRHPNASEEDVQATVAAKYG
jgi:hypothetical protein